MAFLRVKQRRGRTYAYLVASEWDRGTGRPRQKVIQYLGPVDRLRTDRIPEAHRTAPVLASIERLREESAGRQRAAADAPREGFLRAILAGDRVAAGWIGRAAHRNLGLSGLFHLVIAPAMEQVGADWEAGRLSVSQEHLATQVATEIVQEANSRIRIPASGGEVVLCVPEGETHILALKMAEGLLRARGLVPVNVTGSAPASSVVSFVQQRRPAAVFVSVTGEECLPKARQLLGALRSRCPATPAFVGGRAVAAVPPGTFAAGVEEVRESLGSFLDHRPDGGLAPLAVRASNPASPPGPVVSPSRRPRPGASPRGRRAARRPRSRGTGPGAHRPSAPEG